MRPNDVFILPGWESSGPTHWQTLWEQQHGYQRVEQHDWLRPLRGDWITRLEDVLLSHNAPDGAPCVLVAHSLGCHLVAAWAAISHNTHRVQAALLVAPPDVELPAVRAPLFSWSPPLLARLPFKSLLVSSEDDPYCSPARAQQFAAAWGSEHVNVGACGHINSASGLGDWPEGRALLRRLIADSEGTLSPASGP